MSKAKIQFEIAHYQDKLGEVNGKLARLRSARAKVSGVSIDITYTLVSHENIKGAHHLAGVRYLQRTEAEERTIKKVNTSLSQIQADAVVALDEEISRAQSEASSYSSTISNLQAILVGMTD